MNISILTEGEKKDVCLEQHITNARQVVWIGSQTPEVYNTITLANVDVFQCSVLYDKESGTWELMHGQVRTHCTRGLKSDRSRACSMCKGCCGYIRTANPDYSLRVPSTKTLLNGKVVSERIILNEGDCISFEVCSDHAKVF